MRNKTTQAFSLIEIIIYIAMVSIFVVGAMRFVWNLLGAQTRTEVSAEMLHNAFLVKERIGQEIRSANDVLIASSTFGVHPGVLTLSTSNGNVVFDTYEKTVQIGGQPATIRTLRMQKGGFPFDLTSDTVSIQKFFVWNRTRGSEPKNIKFEFTFSYVNPGNDPVRNKTFNFESATTARKK